MSDTPTYDQLSALCAQMAAALVKCRVAGLSTDGPYDARREASDAIDNAITAYRTLRALADQMEAYAPTNFDNPPGNWAEKAAEGAAAIVKKLGEKNGRR